MSDKKKRHYCSFCGKTDEEVAAMVTAYDATICNECTLVCAELMRTDLAGLLEYKSWERPTLTEDK